MDLRNLESTIRTKCRTTLRNCTVTYGVSTFGGVYSAPSQESIGLVTGYAPYVLIASTDAAGMAEDDDITIDSTGYRITSLHPDGYGETRVMLRMA